MSTLKVNSITPTREGLETYYMSRAWGSFTINGQVSVNNDGNVSSVIDCGSNDITVSFRNQLASANYAAVCVNSTGDAVKRAATVRPRLLGNTKNIDLTVAL